MDWSRLQHVYSVVVFIVMVTVFLTCIESSVLYGVFSWRNFYNNFHTVEKSKLYRSGQLSQKDLEFYVKKYNIKTIINLRGAHSNENWWIKETELSVKLGIKHYDILMSADYLTSKESIKQLLHFFEEGPFPILIHCRSGVDRVGEAAALWKLEIQKKKKHEALKQLAFFPYMHFEWLHPAKKFIIKIWKDGKIWLKDVYDPLKYPQYRAR